MPAVTLWLRGCGETWPIPRLCNYVGFPDLPRASENLDTTWCRLAKPGDKAACSRARETGCPGRSRDDEVIPSAGKCTGDIPGQAAWPGLHLLEHPAPLIKACFPDVFQGKVRQLAQQAAQVYFRLREPVDDEFSLQGSCPCKSPANLFPVPGLYAVIDGLRQELERVAELRKRSQVEQGASR